MHAIRKSFRSQVFLAAFILLLILYVTWPNLFWCNTRDRQENVTIINQNFVAVNEKQDTKDSRYLLDSPSCRILDLDPFSEDAMNLFHPVEFEVCNDKHLLTWINHLDNGSFAVSVEEDVVKEYHVSKKNLNCCYESVTRGHGDKADSEFSKSRCIEIVGETVLDESDEFILVTCVVHNSTKVVYKDAHAIVHVKPDVRTRLDEFKAKRTKDKMEAPPSVLMFGIDSVSRLNFRRVMPKTLQHLQSTGWVELNAYNKMGDNTFPNLMAVFGGFDFDRTGNICNPYTPWGLDNCSLIWRDFHDNGYTTAYSEDAASIHTFNYYKEGFMKQPTDYYSRPYFMAMESSFELRYDSYCLGSFTASERIMKYMTDFTTTFKNDPNFGIFWINTLCHDTLTMPPSVDVKIKETFEELSNSGVLNSTIVFFFSDHGLRFGPIRELATGLVEERLPFMHVWVPEKFRASHPELFKNLVENSNKLTTPYDVHMTLQHILSLSSNHTERSSQGCPNCGSILKPIPFDRSCAEAGVNIHWCACEMYELLNVNDSRVRTAAEFVIHHINNVILQGYNQCDRLELNQVLTARGGADAVTGAFRYLLVFETKPGGAKFESTVTTHEDKHFEIHTSPSRINSIATDGKCVDNGMVKLYCHCEE